MMDAYAQDIAQAAQVAANSMSVGDATGPIGLLVAALVALDRFGLLRRASTQDDAAIVRLDERLKNQQREIDAIRSATTAAVSDHRREIADRLRRLEDDVREAIRKASE